MGFLTSFPPTEWFREGAPEDRINLELNLGRNWGCREKECQEQVHRCAVLSKDVHLKAGGHWSAARILFAQQCGTAAAGECAFFCFP